MLSEFNNIIPNFYCEKEKIDNINLDDYKFKIFKSNISILKKKFVNRYTNFNFNDKYIEGLLLDKTTKIMCLSIDEDFNSNNIP